MKTNFALILIIFLIGLEIHSQNTLDNLGLTGTTPAQAAYGLRQLSTTYIGPAIKVRRSSDNLEANIGFDPALSPKEVSFSSSLTIIPSVTVGSGLGILKSGTISSNESKTGTITIVVLKTGNIIATLGSTSITGSGTQFLTELAIGDQLFKSDNTFLGIVKTIQSNTSLTLNNGCLSAHNNLSFKTTSAIVTGNGTNFSGELSVGQRIYKTDNTYLGTISSIISNGLMRLNARDAVAVSGIGYAGTSSIITGTNTFFSSELTVGQLLISNNITLGIISTITNDLQLTLASNAGAAVSDQSYKSYTVPVTFGDFSGLTDVFVKTWYDQSGYGRDALQVATTTNQPKIVSSGSLINSNGRPSIQFSSSMSSFLRTGTPATWLTGTPYTLNCVSAEASSNVSSSTYSFILSTSGYGGPNNTISHFGYRNSNQFTLAQYGSDINFTTQATTSLELHSAVKTSATTCQFFKNGVSLGTLSNSQATNLTDLGLFSIGYYSPVSNAYFNGSISEIVIFSTALSGPDISNFNSNQISHFSISNAFWTGDLDNNWNNAGNWSNGTIPGSTSPAIVVIPAGRPRYPNITGTSAGNSIVINSGGAITVTSPGKLQIGGSLNNSGTFNSTSGTVELIGAAAQTFSNTTPIQGLIINNSSGVSLNGNLTVSGNLTCTSGLLTIGGLTLTLGGTMSGTGGLRGSSNSNLVVTGSPVLIFDQSTPGNTNLLKNFTMNGSNQVATLANNLVINNNSTGLTFLAGKLAIGNNTLTIKGGVINTVAGGLRGSAGSNLIVEGATNRTISFDQTTPGSTNLLNNLTVNTTATNIVTINNDLSVNATLTVGLGQTLDLGTNLLGGTLNSVVNNGTIETQNSSSTPIPSGKTWGGTVSYNNNTLAQNAISGTYNNLTISTPGGATASGDITVNGILNLNSANPSANKGCLEMTISYGSYPGTLITDYLNSFVLNMGATSTTTGIGDVTGRVRRSVILENTAYSFGHQFTTISLSPGTMPTAISVYITIGTTPPGIPKGFKRTYEIVPEVPVGYTSTSHLSANFHYLANEMTSSISPYHTNTEANTVTWDYDIAGGYAADEHGRAAYDFTNKFIGLANVPIDYFITLPTHLWRTVFTLSDFVTNHFTWNGSVNSDWGTSTNWTPTGLPSDLSHVIIPNTSLTPNDPVLPSVTTINTMTIEEGGILTMGNSTLNIKTSLSGGWEDQNPVGNDPGTSKVVFLNPGSTLSGNSLFYDIEIVTGADLTNQAGSSVNILNSLTRYGTGKWYADVYDNTVVYGKSGSQTVLIPDGTGSYRSITLGGSGTKTFPASSLSIHGNLTLSGGVSASPTHPLSILGNFTLGSGTEFTSGSLSHSIGGNFQNNGSTFNSNSGTFVFNGLASQTIGGTTTSLFFSDMDISNSSGVTLLNNTLTSGLNISSGFLTVIAGKSLTSTGTTSLGSPECLILKSDAGGTASFIDNGTIAGIGTAKIERYLSPYNTIPDQKFHFISSPVSNSQLIEPEFIDLTSSSQTDFYKWNELINTWINFRGQNFGERNEDFGDDFKFSAGKGYLAAYPAAVTKNFIGTPFTSSSGLTLFFTNTPSSGDGWNLIGNPFPSSIDWSLITKGTGIDNALYYYDSEAQSYKYYVDLSGNLGTATQYIPPMQGFMIHAKTTGEPSVTFSNDARTHSGQNINYKDLSLTNNILDIKLQSGLHQDYARICFFDLATPLFDGEYDAYKLFSYAEGIPQIYTLTSNNESLAINTFPTLSSPISVPLGFENGNITNHTISGQNLESFGYGISIILEDLKTGISTNFSENSSYSFSSQVSDNPLRFIIHFFPTITGNNFPEISQTIIYVNNNIYVQASEAIRNFRIYDVSGRLILESEGNGSNIIQKNFKPASGIYFIKLITEKGKLNGKFIVN